MTSLGPQQQNLSYNDLLQIPGGVTGQLQQVQDGSGNITGLWLSSVGSNVLNSIVEEQVITASAGQTVFNLSFSYEPLMNTLQVYVDGLNQIVDIDYLETNATTVTFLSPLSAGQLVKFTTALGSVSTTVNASNITMVGANGTVGVVQDMADPTGAAFVGFTGANAVVGNVQDLADPDGAAFVGFTGANAVVGNVQDLADPTGSDLVGFKQAGTGAVNRTALSKMRETVSVLDFGAVGTANIVNQSADTAAFTAALATGKNVFVPEGTYYLSATASIGYGQKLYGNGRGKTTIYYSGSANAVYMGGPGFTTLIYDCELSGLTIICTSRASTVNGVYLDNAVYFKLSDLTIVGSGSPNATNPADRTLYGSGVLITNNSIIGEICRVSCRQWENGRYYKTLSTSPSAWTAAILDYGQGELATCMRGIQIGDPTVPYTTASSVTLFGLTFQGNYTCGLVLNTGNMTVVQNCYFEGNSAHDVVIGNIVSAPQPICCVIEKCVMDSEGIGTNPYGGSTTYFDKINILAGYYTKIRDNDLSISTAIPLIQIAVAADTATISGNRLNSAAAVSGRIVNNSTSTITYDNAPEAPDVGIGSFIRNLAASSGNVSITGLGFKPTSIEFICAVDSTNEQSQGYCGLTITGYENRCVSTDGTGANWSSGNCIRLIRTSAGNEQKAVLSSMDNDGFTLTWTKVGSPPGNDMIVNYIARR